MSYWVQTGLAVLGFLGTIFWKWTVPNIYVGFMAQRHGWTDAREKSKPVYRIAQKHLSRLMVALTDFHKAQCFFVLATNIAALVVTRRGGLEPPEPPADLQHLDLSESDRNQQLLPSYFHDVELVFGRYALMVHFPHVKSHHSLVDRHLHYYGTIQSQPVRDEVSRQHCCFWRAIGMRL